MKELIEIVGEERFFDDPEILESYSKDMSFAFPIRPRCVVMPRSSGEVMEIIKWANKTLTPLIPVSSGPPRFRGDTVPSVGGAVVVDLNKMKRIVRVDRRNRVAIVEPGVTFAELIQALAKEDLAPLMPLMPRSTKSVVASVLETDPITVPRYSWDTQDPLRCAEVIFGNGELFRTGDAVGPGDLDDQWKIGKAQSRGLGPTYVDFSKLLQRAQGTIGIVTWASIGCRPLPKVKEAFLVPSEKLEPLIELVYKVMWRKLGTICLILNSCNLACILEKSERDIVRLRGNLPAWILIFTIESSGLLYDEKQEYYKAEFISLAQYFGLEPMSVVSGVKAEDVMNLLSGVSPEPYWKLRLKGGVQELFFITTMNRVPEFVKRVYEVSGFYKYSTENIGVYIQPTIQGANCHCEFDLYYNPRAPEETEIAKKVFCEAAKAMVKTGGLIFARPYGLLRDITFPSVASPYIIVSRKVKSIFDPNNIMNPGKLYFV